MSQVLDYIRSQDERLKDVPDEELAMFVADTQPEFLQDEEFASQVYKLTSRPKSGSAVAPVTEQRRSKVDRDTDQAAAAWGWGSTNQAPTNEANAITTYFEAAKEMAGDNPAMVKRLEEARRTELQKLGVEPLTDVDNPLKTIAKPVGQAVARGTKVTQAAVGDLASMAAGVPAENLKSFANAPDSPLPIEKQVQEAEGWWRRAAGYLGLSGAAAPVFLGGAAGLTAAGVPPIAANAAMLGVDAEGRPNPIGIAAAFGLPIVDQWGREMTSKAIQAVFDKVKVVRTELDEPGRWVAEIQNRGLLQGLKHDEILKGLEIGGGQLADNAYLLALQTPGILASEDPKEALTAAVASNLATALMGAPELKAGGKSITYETLKQRFATGQWPEGRVTVQPNAPAQPTLPQEAGKAAPPEPPATPSPTPSPTPPAPPPAQPPAVVTPTTPPAATPSAPPVGTPDPADPQVTLGRPTTVRGSNESQFPAFYAWVPAEKIQGSHLPGFAVNPNYAPLENTRRYDTDLAEQEKVTRGATTFDPSSYATNVRSAADGPIMVSRSNDGHYRILGGNGRWQMIQSLTPEQVAEFGRVQDEEAAVFGLPVRPADNAVLVRLLPPTDLSSAQGLANAKRVVDLLNPSPGLVETTASMARNDAAKVDLASVQALPAQPTPKAARQWITEQMQAGTIDRNTRAQILGNENQSLDFVARLRLQAAYADEAVVELALSPKSSESTKALIGAPVSVLLALRIQQEPKLARSLSDMLRRVSEYQESKGLTLDSALRWFVSQGELDLTPEMKLAKNLAVAIGGQIEKLPPNKRGERKIDFDETRRNFDSFFSSLATAIRMADRQPDLMGQVRGPDAAISDFIRSRMGDSPLLVQEPDGGYEVRPNPNVARLNKLTDLGRTRKLTPTEEAERAALEASVGQGFMQFWTEQRAAEQRGNAEQQALELQAGAAKRLIGADIMTQKDMFGPPSDPGGQLTLLDRGRRGNRRDESQIEFNFAPVPVVSVQGQQPAAGGGQRSAILARVPTVQGWRLAAARVKDELIRNGAIDIVGRRIRSVEEAAVLLQLFRDPQFEIFHWIFVRGDVVVGRESVTARRADEVAAFTNIDTAIHLQERMKKLRATGYYVAHNHPSGDPTPSFADQHVTKLLDAQVSGFLGHIVINHTQYAEIYYNGDYGMRNLPGVTGPDPLKNPPGTSGASQLLGRLVIDSHSVARMQAEIRENMTEGVVQLMLMGARLHVHGVIDVDVAAIHQDEFPKYLSQFAESQGATRAIALYLGSDTRVMKRLDRLINFGVLMDAYQMPDQPSESHKAKSHRETLVTAYRENTFFGTVRPSSSAIAAPFNDDGRLVLRDEVPDERVPTYEFQYGPKDNKTGQVPTITTGLGRLDLIRPAEMPEMVRLARNLLGHFPQIRRLPEAHGVFSRAAGRATIKLSPQIFANPIWAAKVLAHEIGHLIDFLPQGTMARGNLFGRIASLREWLKTTFPLRSTTPITEVLTPKDRAAIRRKAESEVGPRPPKDEEADLAAWQAEVSRVYRERIDEEIERRGLAKIEVVREELWELSKAWRPLPEGDLPESYLQYRQSGVELYADAISALFNSPGFLEETAPTFYGMFWEYLDRKPEVKGQLFDLQDLLWQGKLATMDQRAEDIAISFAKGEAKMRAAAEARELRRRSWKGWWTQLAIDAVDQNFAARRKAAAAGDEATVRQLDELGMRDTRIMGLVREIFERVVQPAEAAGFTIKDVGTVLLLERIISGDRAQLANPLGHTPLTARTQLWRLRHNYGLDAWTNLKRAVDGFHDIVWGVVEEAVEVGVYNRETFEKVLVPNRDFYAAFAVVDYLEDYVPPGIRQQMGTFKEVANPLVATTYKMVALANLNAWNRAKRSVRDMLQRHFQNEIRPAELVGPFESKRPKTHPDFGVLSPLENGKPEHWYVDPYIAQAFEEVPPMHLSSVVRMLDTGFRSVLYPLIITYNPGFLFITSPIREVRRTGRNLPVHFGRLKLLREYARVWSDVVERFRGNATPLTRELEGTLALATPFDTVAGFNRDDALGRLMERYKLAPPPEPKNSGKVVKLIKRLAKGVEFWGMVVDSLPKYGAYNILRRELHYSPKDAAGWVRSYAGLPNIKNKGRSQAMTRALSPFWNVFTQGWRADARLMRSPKTRAGYWLRWGLSDGMWTMIQALAASGILGAALKSLYDGISEYKKTNYTVVPLGTMAGGDFGQKVAYLQIPRDETDRLLSGMVYKLISSIAGGKANTTLGQDLADMLSFGAGQVPGLNPLLTIGSRWMDYARNVPPIDPLTGRPIVPTREWNAGGIDSLAPMASWTLAQGRLNIFGYDTKADRTIEMVWNAMPVGGRFIQVTDYGYREQQRGAEQAAARRDAKRVLSYSDQVRGLIGEYNHLRGLETANRTETQQRRMLELAPWYNSVYRPTDELIERAESERDTATANQARRALDESAKELKRK